ncbi:sialic acid-binding Ig-like lectin 5 [Microcaecilia unicolor]|uniref:Sialic acid-binding Ig-like lectin 5 n=1 Tax=Microcaecilia unicolor TaxID=1415580 RepID=A0A6P7YXF7_9AMPH|nr:sialic acid-binding Ig-like lectin 5 [Microcaecilia unicolor]
MPRAALFLLMVIWKGFLAQLEQSEYHLASNAVETQRGLCTLIHCRFTFPIHNSLGDNPKAFWSREDHSPIYHPPVVSSDPDDHVHPDTIHRFKFLGDLRKRECNFRIDDATYTDAGAFVFNIQGDFFYSYILYPVRVQVNDLNEKPLIQHPSELIAGAEVTIICTAPGRCRGTPPNIIWKGTLKTDNITEIITIVNGDLEVTYSSSITFTPSIMHHDQTLICQVFYPAVDLDVLKEITLNVIDPATTTTTTTRSPITAALIHKMIATTIDCNTEDTTTNPTSRFSIRPRPSPSPSPEVKPDPEDYINPEDFPDPEDYLDPETQPKPEKPDPEDQFKPEYWPKYGDWLKSNCKEEYKAITCTCWIRSNPPPVLRWMINEEIVTGNFSNLTMQMFSSTYGHKAKGTLILHDIKASTVFIHCLNANKEDTSTNWLDEFEFEIFILIICGSIIFIALTLLCAFFCGKRSKRREKGKRTRAEKGWGLGNEEVGHIMNRHNF